MSSSKPGNDPGGDVERTLQLARRYLRFGARSTAQLRAHLEAHSLPASSIEDVLAACARRGWLDDAACAKLWVTMLAERGYAWAAIRDQLLTKGLNAGLIDRALQPLHSLADDERRARQLIQHRLRGRAIRTAQVRAQMARLLARRGFDRDLIEQLVQ